MISLPEMPPSIATLPKDERGYPVPWFVAWIDGKPEFRIANGDKRRRAFKEKLCWVCGGTLDPKQHVFVIGPMSAINCVTSEPPCHAECAEFSAKACPFLSMPKAQRREAGLEDIPDNTPGIAIRRNPGVACLWFCRGYKLFDDSRGGVLVRLPGPSMVRWFAEGRKATRAEILESIETGLPILRAMAEQDGPSVLRELEIMTASALRFVPAA